MIPFDVDLLFPRFTQIVQKALNGSNSASTKLGALETAVALSDLWVQLSGEEEWE